MPAQDTKVLCRHVLPNQRHWFYPLLEILEAPFQLVLNIKFKQLSAIHVRMIKNKNQFKYYIMYASAYM